MGHYHSGILRPANKSKTADQWIKFPDTRLVRTVTEHGLQKLLSWKFLYYFYRHKAHVFFKKDEEVISRKYLLRRPFPCAIIPLLLSYWFGYHIDLTKNTIFNCLLQTVGLVNLSIHSKVSVYFPIDLHSSWSVLMWSQYGWNVSTFFRFRKTAPFSRRLVKK